LINQSTNQINKTRERERERERRPLTNVMDNSSVIKEWEINIKNILMISLLLSTYDNDNITGKENRERYEKKGTNHFHAFNPAHGSLLGDGCGCNWDALW